MLSQKVPLSPVLTQEMTRVLGTLCRELGTETKCVFLFISQCAPVTDRSVIADCPCGDRMTNLPGCPWPHTQSNTLKWNYVKNNVLRSTH